MLHLSILPILLSLTLVACSPRELHLAGKTMGTTWHATIIAPSSTPSEDAIQSALQRRLDELDTAFTNWRGDCPVTRFNASRSTEWQSEPRELVELVLFGRQLSELTGGAFDVTVSPLVDLWGFGPKGRVKEPPPDSEIRKAMSHVGWKKLETRLNPPALRKSDPELEINVSSMADGYAVDELTRLLRGLGLHDFLIEVGGAVYASGTNKGGSPWQVGIQHPEGVSGDLAAALPLREQAMSTSGVYRQYFEKDGRRYAHILDARSGRPIEHALVSVTVVTDTGFKADGWDTALLILGPVEGKALAQREGISAFFMAEPAAPKP